MKFHKNILKSFALDLGFIIVMTVLLLFIKNKLQNYLDILKQYGPSLALIDPNTNVLEAQQVLQEVSELANKAILFIIIIPIIVFLLYVIFHGYNFYLLKKKKNYLLKFGLISLPGYAFLIVMLNYLFFDFLSWIILILLFFTAFVFYLQPNKKGFINLLKKYYYVIPGFIGYLVILFFIIFFIIMFYLQTLININMYWLLLLALIFIFGLSWYRYWLVERFG